MKIRSAVSFVEEADHWPQVVGYLEGIRTLVPNASSFVRRFSWMPVDVPVSINGSHPCDAEYLLTLTTETAQVLTNVWISFDSLLNLVKRIEFDLLDVEIFDGLTLQLYGSLKYFEYSVVIESYDPTVVPNISYLSAKPLPSSLDIQAVRLKTQMVTTCNPLIPRQCRLTQESLAEFGTLEVDTTPYKLSQYRGFSVNVIQGSELPSFLARICNADIASWISFDNTENEQEIDSHIQLSLFSILQSIDHLAESSLVGIKPHLGTFLFFNAEMVVVAFLERRLIERPWTSGVLSHLTL